MLNSPIFKYETNQEYEHLCENTLETINTHHVSSPSTSTTRIQNIVSTTSFVKAVSNTLTSKQKNLTTKKYWSVSHQTKKKANMSMTSPHVLSDPKIIVENKSVFFNLIAITTNCQVKFIHFQNEIKANVSSTFRDFNTVNSYP